LTPPEVPQTPCKLLDKELLVSHPVPPYDNVNPVTPITDGFCKEYTGLKFCVDELKKIR